MIKAVIIDDEINAQNLLEKTLQHYFPNKFAIMAKCDSVASGVIAIKNHQPELVFLDIQMPEENGFELFKHFKMVNFEVIFTTAFNQFAIKAIKCSALDYLLKPIDPFELTRAIKVFDAKSKENFTQKKLTILLENLDSHNTFKIALPTIEGFELINTNQILYCKADSNYCVIKKIDNTTKTISKSLKNIEELLPHQTFIRVHKSTLINLNYVSKYNKSYKEIELTNGEKIPVSFRKETEFIDAIFQK
ncbi:MAG: LytTR family DNA-binding domain-containing protein [Flavobacteriaceae bacterium]|nr:LytTR family DNA-binding domain-containing protein [Flavobacteriaceae bacterium]